MLELRWHCVFTVLSLVLALIYTLLLGICAFYSLRLLRVPCTKRQSQRVFLVFTSLQCLLRAIYFFAWPLVLASEEWRSPDDCSVYAEGEHDSVLMSLAGSLPSALFISAFSVNARTFARIYYATLVRSTRKTRRGLLDAFILAINAAVYATLILLHLSHYSAVLPNSVKDVADTVYVYTLTGSAFLVSVTFAVYGVALHRGVKRRMEHEATSQEFYLMPESASSSSLSSAVTVTGTGQSSSLLKVAVISCLCLLCFLVRVILLPVLESVQHGQFSFSLLLLYLCLSEMVPLLLILYLFDPLNATRRGRHRASHAKEGEYWAGNEDLHERWTSEGIEDGLSHSHSQSHSAASSFSASRPSSPLFVGSGSINSAGMQGAVSGSSSLSDSASLPPSISQWQSSTSPSAYDAWSPRRRPAALYDANTSSTMSYTERFKMDLKQLIG